MNLLFIILSIMAVPAIFFTLFARTEKGQKIKLGSYFLVRNLDSRIFRVRSLKDKPLLIARLVFASIMAILVVDPLDLDVPDRNSVLHNSKEKVAALKIEKGKKVRLNVPDRILDSFDEDVFFLNSLAKNLPASEAQLVIVYDPDKERLRKEKGDKIIFPGINQDKNVFEEWNDIFYLSDLLEIESKIKDSEYSVKKYFRPVFVDENRISIFSKLENGFPVAFSFKDKGKRILFFTTGIAESWGDAGLSGQIMDIIIGFQNNISMSGEALIGDTESLKKYGEASGKIPYMPFLYSAVLFFLFELLIFAYRSWTFKKGSAVLTVLLLLIFPGTDLFAGGFQFIELDINSVPDVSNRTMFSIIKKEVERSSSIKIDPVFYKKITTAEMAKGKMPELPYLWIIGCKDSRFFSSGLREALSKFMERGGIIFIETCGKKTDSQYLSEIKDFLLEQSGYNPRKGVLPRLPSDHAIYKSFYILYEEIFYGIDISRFTKRTALIVSRGEFKNRVLRRDKTALRTSVNVILYMLSGNYKSDQIHTRQILKKLKKRELYR